MATKTKNIGMILPHRWQKVGWWLLAAAFLCFIGIEITCNDAARMAIVETWSYDSYDQINLILCLAHSATFNLALFFLCLSCEREEDEFITFIRMGIIKRLVCFWLIAKLIEGLAIYVTSHIFNPQDFFKVQTVFSNLTGYYFLALVYIIWLKISLYRIRKEAARD